MQTPLYSFELEHGARFADFEGWEIPNDYGNTDTEYARIRNTAGIVDLCYRAKLSVTGEDRVPYLHRMLSNSVQDLRPGEGNYCFLLNAQGQIQADMNLLQAQDRIILDTEPVAAETLRQTLERFIIMDQVEISDISAKMGTIGVEGPLAQRVVNETLGGELPAMKPLDHVLRGEVLVVRASMTGEGLWVMAPAAQCLDLARRLLERAREAGGGLAGHLAAEIARVEAGVPRFGADITQTNIPQETGQLRGLSFTKGCYPGQEIVERVRSRGHVNRQLVGLMAKGAAQLEPGSAITAQEQTAGRVMTAVYSPGLRRSIALAYVRRDYTQPGTTIETPQGQAEVTALPFPRFK